MLLSFIIPTYNRGEIFNRTLLSLVDAIEGLPIEVIVVNDYKKEDLKLPVQKENIRLVNNPKQGASSARNYGASLAKGEYFVFLDDDILINKKNIQTIIDLHKGQQKKSFMIDWVYPEELMKSLEGNKFGRFLIDHDLTSMRGWKGGGYWNANEPFRVYSAASCSLVLHRDVFHAVNGYNEQFPLAGFEDHDFPKRLMDYGVEFYIYPLDLIYHNESDRVELKSFLKRKYNTSVTRKIAVDIGYTELELKYPFFRKSVFVVLTAVEPLLYSLAHMLPNSKWFNYFYNKLANILVAINIYKGYTK